MKIILEIFYLLLWLRVMIRCGSFSNSLPFSYRIQASLLSLFLVLDGGLDFRLIALLLYNPQAFAEHFSRESGVLPPRVAIVIVIAASLIGFAKVQIGYWMAIRDRRGFTAPVYWAPVFIVIGMLDFTRAFQKYANRSRNPVILYCIAFACIIIVYSWLYLFAKNPKNRCFISKTARVP
jgi:hypothetical protein